MSLSCKLKLHSNWPVVRQCVLASRPHLQVYLIIYALQHTNNTEGVSSIAACIYNCMHISTCTHRVVQVCRQHLRNDRDADYPVIGVALKAQVVNPDLLRCKPKTWLEYTRDDNVNILISNDMATLNFISNDAWTCIIDQAHVHIMSDNPGNFSITSRARLLACTRTYQDGWRGWPGPRGHVLRRVLIGSRSCRWVVWNGNITSC